MTRYRTCVATAVKKQFLIRYPCRLYYLLLDNIFEKEKYGSVLPAFTYYHTTKHSIVFKKFLKESFFSANTEQAAPSAACLECLLRHYLIYCADISRQPRRATYHFVMKEGKDIAITLYRQYATYQSQMYS